MVETTGGIISTTGIAGLTLGGGIGFLARRCGLACDNLVSAEVVTADGELLTCSEEQNRDLCEVTQARDQLVLTESLRLCESSRRLAVLAAQEMALGTPENPLKASLRRRPLLGTRFLVHGDDRA